jgi:hypothetical protein
MRRLIAFLRNAYRDAATASRARKSVTEGAAANDARKAAYDALCAVERLAHLVAADAVIMRHKLQRETDSQL